MSLAHFYFIFFLAALGLHCCVRAFSICGGFSCCGARALGSRASVVVVHRLSSCGSQALELGLSSCGARALGPVGFSSCGSRAW